MRRRRRSERDENLSIDRIRSGNEVDSDGSEQPGDEVLDHGGAHERNVLLRATSQLIRIRHMHRLDSP